MKNNILELIKSSANNQESYQSLVDIYTLYEQLQFATNINQIASDIFDWLEKKYNIDNLIFSLFDINKDEKEDILIKGQDFYLDDEYSFFFIINTHTNLNATVSFRATSKVHYKIIEEKYSTIEAAFFQISPIVQNGILKKNFIDASSLDSVTSVYTRNYLIDNLSNHLKLSNKKQDEIFFLMIGIDHFKAVIDEFDYDMGDKVLIELAKVIHTNINEFDMVGRLNGDEFLVILLSEQSENSAKNIALNIIKDFATCSFDVLSTEPQQQLHKTICIGFESFKINSDHSLIDSIKNADIALYEAKNRGRGTLFDFSELQEEDTIDLF